VRFPSSNLGNFDGKHDLAGRTGPDRRPECRRGGSRAKNGEFCDLRLEHRADAFQGPDDGGVQAGAGGQLAIRGAEHLERRPLQQGDFITSRRQIQSHQRPQQEQDRAGVGGEENGCAQPGGGGDRHGDRSKLSEVISESRPVSRRAVVGESDDSDTDGKGHGQDRCDRQPGAHAVGIGGRDCVAEEQRGEGCRQNVDRNVDHQAPRFPHTACQLSQQDAHGGASHKLTRGTRIQAHN
jgi:hypothetical protein